MMHLDPRPLNPEDLTFQENARLMSYIREVLEEREHGAKKQRDLDVQEERARDIWYQAKTNFIPEEGKDYEVVCRRMDWFHGLYQLSGEEHVCHHQVSSWDPAWEQRPFPNCAEGMQYEPLFGDHSPYRKDQFSPYREVHFGMLFREHVFAFRSKRFMDAVRAYYAEEDWMWRNNEMGQGIEQYIWKNYFDPEEDLLWPFGFEEGDAYFDVLEPRWYGMGGRPLTWCTYSIGMWCSESSTCHYGFREFKPGNGLHDLPF